MEISQLRPTPVKFLSVRNKLERFTVKKILKQILRNGVFEKMTFDEMRGFLMGEKLKASRAEFSILG